MERQIYVIKIVQTFEYSNSDTSLLVLHDANARTDLSGFTNEFVCHILRRSINAPYCARTLDSAVDGEGEDCENECAHMRDKVREKEKKRES